MDKEREYDFSNSKKDIRLTQREGGRYSKSSLVFAVTKGWEIQFHLDDIEFMDKIFSSKNTNEKVTNSVGEEFTPFSATIASELRYLKRFWDKSKDKTFKKGNDYKNKNHKAVYAHLGGGFKNANVKFYRNNKVVTNLPWEEKSSK